MVKIIGFTKRIDGYRTSKGFMNTDLFINSCKRAAKDLNVSFDTLYTKRQSTKFRRGTGIVYQATIAA